MLFSSGDGLTCLRSAKADVEPVSGLPLSIGRGLCYQSNGRASSNMRIESNGNDKSIDISIFVLRGFSACCWCRRACLLV